MKDREPEYTIVKVEPAPPGAKTHIAPVDRARCGAKTRNGAHCKRRAGERTVHVGEGRCWMHGGRKEGDARLKHGRYASVSVSSSVGELLEKHRADPDPLNVLDDLALLRSLIEDFIARNVEYGEALLKWNAAQKAENPFARPARVPDIVDAAGLLDLVSKVVERVERMRNANHISRADFNRIVHEYWRSVDARVLDVVTKGKIREDWLSVRL